VKAEVLFEQSEPSYPGSSHRLSPKIVAFQQVSELADCGLVRHRLPPQIDVAGRAHAPRSGITRCRRQFAPNVRVIGR
jgi:hypothetical protein